MTIRPAAESDWPAVWQLFRAVCAAGDSFAYDTDTTEATARKLWFDPPAAAWVAEEGGVFLGTYYLRPNQPGRGGHVANAGYMVAEAARGRGLAAELCRHSLVEAADLGYRAVQFNYVVSTNTAAVRAWERCGFRVVGTLPATFRHATLGEVDVLVMWRAVG